MIQLYLLSIVCNSLIGYLLFAGSEDKLDDKGILIFLNNPTLQLVLGILSTATGVLKLLSPTKDNIPIIGDLLPAAGGIIAGLLLIFGIYRQNMPSESQSFGALERFGSTLLRFRKSVGLGLLVISLLHFLFPSALFL